jgi:hypothetical protein
VIELTPEHTVLVLDRGSDYQAGVLRAALVIFGPGVKVAAEMFSTPSRAKVEQLLAEYLRRRRASDGPAPDSFSSTFDDADAVVKRRHR